VVKPETCVSGPVTFDVNFSTKKIEWFLKKDEICAYAGALYKKKAAFAEHFEVAKKQLTALICALSPEELRAIVKIDEPQTFKIGEDDLPQVIVKKLCLK
jgi:fructose-1-phosphate kinase PfkB-like protein